MDKRNLTLALLAILVAPPVYFASCAEDRWALYADQTQSDRWIDDTMRVWYYWNQGIPHTNDLNYFTDPFKFFSSLLSEEDGNGGEPFSTIDSLPSGTRSIPYTDYSYGFQFTTNRVEGNDTALYAHVLYVAPGSPAGDIGLQRGDWIMEMDGRPITEDNYARLYGSGGMSLTIGHYDVTRDTIASWGEPLAIAPARSINDDPVHYTQVYQAGGRQVGYLVYNHFTPGLTASGHEYDDELRQAFQGFASQQVNEFILDLRYNNGGSIASAELLCTLLAPASALGQPLGTLEFNARFSPTQMLLDESLIGTGANLNLRTLYVLTSGQTASASELLINCLRPYMDVVLVGATTVGKNYGTMTFTNPDICLTMSPVVCKIYNSRGESDYTDGFAPDVQVSEDDDLSRFLPFGDPDEMMLHTALGLIGGEPTTQQVRKGLGTTVLHNSAARRASRGVELKK